MLARKRQSITGKTPIKHIPSIKPSKTRKIIRRFHFLIQKRTLICNKLGLVLLDNDEQFNQQLIESEVRKRGMWCDYEVGLGCHVGIKMEQQLLAVQRCDDILLLVKLLGFIMAELNKNGGLQNYQLASTIGQSGKRGGDSSKILVKWFKEMGYSKGNDLRVLEIGSLSASNYISTSGVFNPVIRIDLNSKDPGNILQQDFMQRQIPTSDHDRFDLISCSLVLNFVSTHYQRGEMILRFQQFLRCDTDKTFVFIVLPLHCMTNSRYMNTEYFCNIMSSLGYLKIQYHEANKVVYFLFRRQPSVCSSPQSLHTYSTKHKLADRPGMNNFSITLPVYKH
ncbi:25S rRNA (adenine2142-N1)-methyltransferase Ecym_5325 [Eremothecium cymbalariae DBVPG|uniref:25S rRNA adenine-N(1) methyltransferase n=1 Tax=Eremothecium cymbalariae (strain CBS 270.75 / DBVPG 7215 / KCTC 17166 / NRRL Y-17582) TaxID=931890 RepID=I6NDE2_ERECY|nr:hypothetical protein Ecym_5325 [Eremothecium cymbalariae DBVPG\